MNIQTEIKPKSELIKIIDIINELSYSYTILPSHILLSLYFIYSNESGGKYSLSKYLGIQTSRTRGIISLLEKKKVIKVEKGRNGSSLTKKGERICQSVFSFIQVIKHDEVINLGNLTLGSFDFLVSIPMTKQLKERINPLKIRDTAIKIGALGASIFQTFNDSNNNFKVNFYDSRSDPSSFIIETLNDDFKYLKEILSSLGGYDQEWLVIAISIDNNLPQYYFNPLFDSKIVKPVHIIRLAGFQSIWELLN